jgi:hypothetical protein
MSYLANMLFNKGIIYQVAPYIPVQHWYGPKVHIPKFPKFHKVYKRDCNVVDFYKGPSGLCLEGGRAIPSRSQPK